MTAITNCEKNNYSNQNIVNNNNNSNNKTNINQKKKQNVGRGVHNKTQ